MASGIAHRRQVVCLQLGQDEAVDLAPWPGVVGDFWRVRRVRRNERPKLAAGLEVDLAFDRVAAVGHARVGRTHPNPLGEIVGDLPGELVAGWHLQFAVTPDRLQQAALGWFAGDDHRAGFAAVEHALLRVKKQLALEVAGLGGVALVTVVRQHWADIFLEKRNARGIRLGGTGLANRAQGHERSPENFDFIYDSQKH